MVSSKWNPKSGECPCKYCDCTEACDLSPIGAYGCMEFFIWTENDLRKEREQHVLHTGTEA